MTTALNMVPSPDERSIALTRDFRLLQKRRGHRYSVDDMLVAHLAARALVDGGRAPPAELLDLGCGLGSVLLILAWIFPTSRCVGLEAQAEHVAFARRNLRLNGCEDRARVVAGDLRDLALVGSLGTFALVTGSPPYFAPGSGTLCADPARAAAHFELCGGIEDYARAARQALRGDGVFATCAPAQPPHRAEAALTQAGLVLRHRQIVVPRPGKEPFLQLLLGTVDGAPCRADAPPLILRQADGQRSVEHRAIRRWTGL